jgi:hypothetical protein
MSDVALGAAAVGILVASIWLVRLKETPLAPPWLSPLVLPLPTLLVLQSTAEQERISQWLFCVSVAAFVIGGLSLVAQIDNGGDPPAGGLGPPEPQEPPWWPEFERDFRRFAKRQSRPVFNPRGSRSLNERTRGR